MKKLSMISLLFIVSFTSVWAKDFWEKKPYTQWSKEEAARILRDSPWTKDHVEAVPTSLLDEAPRPGLRGSRDVRTPGTEGGLIESGTTGRQSRDYSTLDINPGRVASPAIVYRVSWYSATPVRQALLRLRQLRNEVSDEQANTFLTPQTEYTIAMSGNDMKSIENLSPEVIKQSAYLTTSSREEKVYVSHYTPPSIEQGQPALFIFPKEVNGGPLITEKDKEVVFTFQNKGKVIKTKFRVKDMMFKDKLDL